MQNEYVLFGFGGLLSVLQAICILMMRWAFTKTVENGEMVAILNSQMETHAKEHKEFVRKTEFDSMGKEVAKLSLAIEDLTKILYIEREDRIRGEKK